MRLLETITTRINGPKFHLPEQSSGITALGTGMSEAPKRIWVWNYAADQMVNEKPDSTDILYVRGDIVEEMREALQSCLDYGGMTGDEWVTDQVRIAMARFEDL